MIEKIKLVLAYIGMAMFVGFVCWLIYINVATVLNCSGQVVRGLTSMVCLNG